MKQNGVTDDALRLYLLPYSLTHHATAWFDRLSKNSIHTFQEMASKFLSKYFPPSMMTKLRNDISNVRQLSDESLFEAWGLLQCYDLIENMTAHHNDWDTSAHRGESSSSTTSSFEIAALTQQMAVMRKDILQMYRSNQQVNSVTPSCEICGGPHSYYECQAVGGYTQDVYATSRTYNAGGKFTFLADFVFIDYHVDPRVPLILGRPFLMTAQALVDVYGEDLILRDGDEKLIFHADSTSKHPQRLGNKSINMVNFIDITCEDRFPEVLNIKKSNHPFNGSTTSPFDSSPSLRPFETRDSLLEEEMEYLLNRDPSTDSSPTTDINIIDLILERLTDKPALLYSSSPGDDDDDDDDLFYLKSDNDDGKSLCMVTLLMTLILKMIKPRILKIRV
nr:hypothetical protein [Tanacetum cinerariifolium]